MIESVLANPTVLASWAAHVRPVKVWEILQGNYLLDLVFPIDLQTYWIMEFPRHPLKIILPRDAVLHSGAWEHCTSIFLSGTSSRGRMWFRWVEGRKHLPSDKSTCTLSCPELVVKALGCFLNRVHIVPAPQILPKITTRNSPLFYRYEILNVRCNAQKSHRWQTIILGVRNESTYANSLDFTNRNLPWPPQGSPRYSSV